MGNAIGLSPVYVGSIPAGDIFFGGQDGGVQPTALQLRLLPGAVKSACQRGAGNRAPQTVAILNARIALLSGSLFMIKE